MDSVSTTYVFGWLALSEILLGLPEHPLTGVQLAKELSIHELGESDFCEMILLKLAGLAVSELATRQQLGLSHGSKSGSFRSWRKKRTSRRSDAEVNNPNSPLTPGSKGFLYGQGSSQVSHVEEALLLNNTPAMQSRHLYVDISLNKSLIKPPLNLY